ncbi:MAG: hypothetical protein ACM34A_01685 [Bacillota bacterium]
MESHAWNVPVYVIAAGYFISVLSCMSEGLGDEWWEPWLLGAVMPFWWLSEHWRDIVSAVALVVIVVLLFVISWGICTVWNRIWGML